MRSGVVATLTLASLGACAPPVRDPALPPTYGPATASFMTDDLVRVKTEMGKSDLPEEARAYADCHAAQAMGLRGVEFARHVRSLTSLEAGIRRTDTVYTVSTTRPRGDDVLVAADTIRSCRDKGIPGV